MVPFSPPPPSSGTAADDDALEAELELDVDEVEDDTVEVLKGGAVVDGLEVEVITKVVTCAEGAAEVVVVIISIRVSGGGGVG